MDITESQSEEKKSLDLQVHKHTHTKISPQLYFTVPDNLFYVGKNIELSRVFKVF